jgi:hypothetical protein
MSLANPFVLRIVLGKVNLAWRKNIFCDYDDESGIWRRATIACSLCLGSSLMIGCQLVIFCRPVCCRVISILSAIWIVLRHVCVGDGGDAGIDGTLVISISFVIGTETNMTIGSGIWSNFLMTLSEDIERGLVGVVVASEVPGTG